MRYIIVDSTIITNRSPKLGRFFVIACWMLELNDFGAPLREVGLDQNGTPAYRAPDGGERGLFTDSPSIFEGPEWVEISREEFEATWARLPR